MLSALVNSPVKSAKYRQYPRYTTKIYDTGIFLKSIWWEGRRLFTNKLTFDGKI
jgi:hypothetical protein